MNDSNDPGWSPRWALWLAGMMVANLAMGLLYGGICLGFSLTQGFLNGLGDSAFSAVVVIFGLPSFVLVPLLGGLVASFVWRVEKPRIGLTAIGALGVTITGLLGSALILREGVICLLIVSPLLYAMIFCGALIGRVWFRRDPTKLRMSVLPLVAVLALGEPMVRSEHVGVITDEILIKAPPARVWPELTSFGPIVAPPRFWMFQIGLPYPMATTSAGDYVGADRRCIFSGDMVFEEKVITCVPGEDLTFDITKLPQHPELIGHITPSRGQFRLRDNGDGTTTLIGSTWYSLQVRPLWYFDWWTGQIFRAVHLRVMEDVRQRAERG